MDKKSKIQYGKWIVVAAIPMIALALYPEALSLLGRGQERYALLYNNYGMPPYILFLLVSITLPFITFFLLRFVSGRKRRKKPVVGIRASAKVIGLEPTGVKLTEGVNEVWGVILSLEVSIPGKEIFYARVQHNLPLLQIPLYQPGKTIEVVVDQANKVVIPCATVAFP
jgi:membrane protein implicated in regulation of membrane protease activity